MRASARRQAQDLARFGAVAVNGDALEAQLIGQRVGLADVLQGGVRGQVDGLGDGVFHVALEGRLHPDLVVHAHLEGGGEEPPELLRQFLKRPHPAGGEDAGHPLLFLQAEFAQFFRNRGWTSSNSSPSRARRR